MGIYQIIYPGTNLKTEEYSGSLDEIHRALQTLQTCIDDLHVSLSSYNAGKEIFLRVLTYNKRKIFKQDSNSEILNGLSEVDIKYFNRHTFVHAHSFVYSLDRYYKILRALENIKPIASIALKTISDFKSKFPSITEVRNSAQHFEDRYKQKAFGKDIISKPFSVDNLNFPDGNVYMVSTFINDKLTYTSANGSLGSVDISDTSLISVVANFQDLISSLSWTGAQRYMPE